MFWKTEFTNSLSTALIEELSNNIAERSKRIGLLV